MRVTLSLPDYIAKDLKAIAEAHGTTQSGVVSLAIHRYLIDSKPPKKKVVAKKGGVGVKRAPAQKGAKVR